MHVPLISPYLDWLQKDNPVGEVERYPEIDSRFQSSVKGVYIVGDLTGVPLLKLASESGAKVVRHILYDKEFKSRTQAEGVSDVLIIGGGPAGVACALECEKQGLDNLVLESSQLFSTLENFPKGKPILAKPDGYKEESPLSIQDGYKETLLEDLRRQIAGKTLRTRMGVRVEGIKRKGDLLILDTNQGEMKAHRVVVAIGKTGDARRLGIPGEDQPFVYNRLFDPGEFHGEDILVVGGGDSAVEAAAALAEAGNRVKLSYRKEGLDRPKPENLKHFENLVAQGRIEPHFSSQPKAIRPGETVLKTKDGEKTVKSDQVFVLIGRELPLKFFKRSGLRMEGQRDRAWYVFLVAMLSFFSMLYFGKAGVARDLFLGAVTPLNHIQAYLTAPFSDAFTGNLNWSLNHYAWYSSLNFYLGWMGSLAFLVSGAWALAIMIKRRDVYFGKAWPRVKYGYFIASALFFTWVYFHYQLGRNAGWVEEPTYYYSLFYSITIVLFGWRRVAVRKTRYVKYQVLSLVVFQVFFLFLLPFHLFEPLITANFAPDSYVMKEIFPSGKWSCFGLVLFWPLDMNDFGTSSFWTWFPFVQTFGILFLIVWQWGKGAYCGWICSCGGMAETLGDEYRVKAPHGKTPKRLDNIGQFVLAAAVIVTAFGYFTNHYMGGSWHPAWVDTMRGIYKLAIDVFFAGILGMGVYFFLSGRIWCRYGCPLAALMHIYTRFSKFRIFAEKKKCISCNICTKVCHMGIDVMNYANKGIPMNDVECVRCSACVQSCPTEVLSFGKIKEAADSENRTRQEIPAFSKDDWKAGIR
ncbi:MAG: NAD(P)-binding domain-containing protein [Fibrobacterota bacterium]|nr:NAD(P)-binding domain-containing protein [Fibrobacterota bacterium]